MRTNQFGVVSRSLSWVGLEAEELNITLDRDQASQAAATTDPLNRQARAIQGIYIQIGAAVAPIVEQAADAIADSSARVSTFVEDNQEAVQAVFAFGAGLVGIGSAVVGFGVGIQAVGFALTR